MPPAITCGSPPEVPEGEAMSREIVNAICQTFPGAEASDPWGGGHDAWKVGGKMFACIGAVMPGVSVKTDSIETAQMLIDLGVGVKAPLCVPITQTRAPAETATTVAAPRRSSQSPRGVRAIRTTTRPSRKLQ